MCRQPCAPKLCGTRYFSVCPPPCTPSIQNADGWSALASDPFFTYTQNRLDFFHCTGSRGQLSYLVVCSHCVSSVLDTHVSYEICGLQRNSCLWGLSHLSQVLLKYFPVPSLLFTLCQPSLNIQFLFYTNIGRLFNYCREKCVLCGVLQSLCSLYQ